jgi:hypothetical protein
VGQVVSRPRYARYTGLLGVLVLALVIVSTLLSKSNDATGIPPGHRLPPFAVPLVVGDLEGDADIATRPDQGSNGRVPACAERGAQILNVCQLYEQGPVVLALFVDGGACTAILREMQTLVPQFPAVRFAAVAIAEGRGQLRRLMRSLRLTLPVGIDKDGALVSSYKVFSCPQIDFAYRGGVVQSRALLRSPSLASLRSRVVALVAASRARERSGPAA